MFVMLKKDLLSGVNTYAELNNTNTKTVMEQMSDNKLCNRHFAPQFVWLFHLYKYFRGTINLKPFQNNTKQIKEHLVPFTKNLMKRLLT